MANSQPKDEEKQVKAVETVAVSVYSAKGGFIRSYSKEIHGPKFHELAKQYAGKINGIVR